MSNYKIKKVLIAMMDEVIQRHTSTDDKVVRVRVDTNDKFCTNARDKPLLKSTRLNENIETHAKDTERNDNGSQLGNIDNKYLRYDNSEDKSHTFARYQNSKERCIAQEVPSKLSSDERKKLFEKLQLRLMDLDEHNY